jgi:hypothetical protein
MTQSNSRAIAQYGRREPRAAVGFFKSGASSAAIVGGKDGGRGNGGGSGDVACGCEGGSGRGEGNGGGIDGPVFTSFATGMFGFLCGAAGASFGGGAG